MATNKRNRKLKKLQKEGKIMSTWRCQNCRFWQKNKPTDEDGDCRFKPPIPFAVVLQGPLGQPQPGVICYFSKTRPDIWCGEFKEKLDQIN